LNAVTVGTLREAMRGLPDGASVWIAGTIGPAGEYQRVQPDYVVSPRTTLASNPSHDVTLHVPAQRGGAS
jgi:hypothetical protein